MQFLSLFEPGDFKIVKFQKLIYIQGNYDIFSHSVAGKWLEKYTLYKPVFQNKL